MGENHNHPVCLLLVSGKRKCGKDFITDAVLDKIGKEMCVIIKISAPIKKHWSVEKGVSFDDLMSSGEMKECHRRAMLDWSEEVRASDTGVFCRAAIDIYKAYEKPIWIVSDARRKTDMEWFKSHFKEAVLTLRIEANEEIRKARGWHFTAGIDDADTECNLDDYAPWDKVICNDGKTEPAQIVNEIITLLSNLNHTAAHLLQTLS